jgi:dipicolinate synthase subunit A
VGVASPYLKNLAEKYGLPITEVAELANIAVPNAIPTAEGAIQLTMEKLLVTIDGLKALVIGYGRVGEALASRLRALGARVTVTNRSNYRFGLAAKDGYHIFPWESFQDALPQMQVVYNTVPSPVLDRVKIAAMAKGSLIIDLASMPGGTDFKAAEELHITAIHALSLPGQVAPVSAGNILAAAYPRIIQELLNAKTPRETAKGGNER